MPSVKIIIATHKKYRMPDDEMYVPVQVGAEGKDDLGYTRDNTGDNISSLNPQFCELTGLYWAWKNLDADYVGLAHYRRHFRGKKKTKDPFDCVLTSKEAEELLKDNDILVTKRRNYYIETIYDHYVHTLYPEPLDETRKIIEEKCPEYLPAFDKHMKGKTMHAFNMFVMKKEYFDAYCEWLFDILFELTKRFEGTEYNSFHARYPGRISEVLLDVWMNENGYTYKEVPFVYMEKIDMFKKGMGFLKAKFLHKKYGESF